MRNLCGLLLLGMLLALGLYWVFGDDLDIYVESFRMSAQAELKKLINERRFDLDRAEKARDQVRQRLARLPLAAKKAASFTQRAEQQLAHYRQELQSAQLRLTAVEGRLAAGQPVRLVSGRLLDDHQARLLAERCRQKTQLANEKIAFFEQLVEQARRHQAKLTQLAEEGPPAVDRIEQSVEFLTEKVSWLEERERWLGEADNVGAGLGPPTCRCPRVSRGGACQGR